jgi:hypothetical protein
VVSSVQEIGENPVVEVYDFLSRTWRYFEPELLTNTQDTVVSLQRKNLAYICHYKNFLFNMDILGLFLEFILLT